MPSTAKEESVGSGEFQIQAQPGVQSPVPQKEGREGRKEGEKNERMK